MNRTCHIPSLLIRHRSRILRFLILFILLLFVGIARSHHYLGEFYATRIYPCVSDFLSHVSTLSHFSWEELIVCIFAVFLLRSLLTLRRHNWKRKLAGFTETALWLIAWFYWGWGLNYFRHSFYERMQINPVAYEDSVYQDFLQEYTRALNQSYRPYSERIPALQWEQEIQNIYQTVPPEAALCSPQAHFRPKRLAFNRLYSWVGVMGYMGPFLCEMQLNEELLPQQYPYTYAHELAHLLGVSSEAEANYWAYKVCTASSDPQVRFSGYLGILPYVMRQTYGNGNAEAYRQWTASIKPEILLLAQAENQYWRDRYSSWIGSIQNTVYETFLKGNQISSGQKNYGQVLSLIISEREQQASHINQP